ncbi:MAG TPA: hypothetical protein VFL42_08670 [Terriglobales bacterium]|nr:hypothetical protein [Terriglobales bacterium]
MLLLRHVGLAGLVLAIAMGAVALGDGPSGDRTEVRPASTSRQAGPTYKVQAGIDGEIYPVFANFASLQGLTQRTFGMVAVTISNPTQAALRQRVVVSLPGWSDEEIQIADVDPGATRTLLFAPPFLPRLYHNREIIAATARVSVSPMTGNPQYESTTPVRLRSAEDIYWGANFKYAPFIASWVTPHDALVERLLAEAKQYTPDKRLPGYETWKTWAQQEQESYTEAKAIFTAVKQAGLSYVKSSLTLGDHQSMSERVRMPNVSLAHLSANCIDAAVMYASMFENLAMEPSIILVPGHAYVGVKVAEGSDKLLYIDVAMTGRMTFEQAVASAQAGMEKQDAASVTQINVSAARSVGIYPMP